MSTIDAHKLSVLAFEGVRLALPSGQVVGAERPSRVQQNAERPPLALGTLVHAGRRWPVFGLDRRYRLLEHLSTACTYCICISADGSETGLALACETLENLAIAGDCPPAEVPISVQGPESPMQRWLLHEERILPITSAPALVRYITGWMEKNRG